MQSNLTLSAIAVYPGMRGHINDPQREKFMLQKWPDIVLKHAIMMDHMAPKTCEKCDCKLVVAELAWRLANNVENFLCYDCIKQLVEQHAELEPTPAGFMSVKKEDNGRKI